jgi:PIN domain nuclease of toxin-antitoxin system
MRLLLDTHIALWALTDDPKLSLRARAILAVPENAIRASVVSLWEIAIKNALRRERGDPLPFSATETAQLFEEAGFRPLPVTEIHAVTVEALDPHHGDPFDRLLVAQALTEGLTLVTSDRLLERYGSVVTLV